MTDGERTEGWGSLDNFAGNAHYFRNGRSLCGRILALSEPRWERQQSRGPEPERRNSGTCKACWRKAPEEAPK